MIYLYYFLAICGVNEDDERNSFKQWILSQGLTSSDLW